MMYIYLGAGHFLNIGNRFYYYSLNIPWNAYIIQFLKEKYEKFQKEENL